MTIRKKTGFTLIELLIVVTILSLLIIAVLASYRSQRDRANDAKAKSELARLKIAFEDYYNDQNCYPPATWFDGADDCGSTALNPYLATIPCDKQTGLPYVVEYDGNTCSKWFKIYSTLSTPSDPSIAALCTTGGSTKGNYGVSSSNATIGIDCSGLAATSPTPTPSPFPSSIPGTYGCNNPQSGTSTCGVYPPPANASCGWTTTDPNCLGYCATSPLAARCN